MLQILKFVTSEECPDLSSPFPEWGIQEVKIEMGKAGASSSWPAGPWSKPESAFRQDIKEAWASGLFESTLVRKPFPHLIWYQFPTEKAFRPAEVTFRSRQLDDKYVSMHAPTKWQFVGSNDEECNAWSVWIILCEDLSGAPQSNVGGIRFCRVPLSVKRKFRCLGVRILHNQNGIEADVQSLRFWKRVIVQ